MMKGPFKMWFNRTCDLEPLRSLVADMNKFYSEPENQVELPSSELRVNALVVVKTLVNYCRARVLKFLPGSVQVELVDSGEKIINDRLYGLSTEFSQHPLYGIQAKLYGTDMKGVSVQDCRRLKALVKEADAADALGMQLVSIEGSVAIVRLLHHEKEIV